jgi:hypothetical protein
VSTLAPTDLPEFDFGDQIANDHVRHVMRVKSAHVDDAKSAKDNTDLLPVCIPSRGKEFLGYYIGQAVDRDLGLEAMHLSVVGFTCTEFVLGLDARMMVFDKNDPKRDVEQGEIQHLAEHGTEEQKGRITEALIVVRSSIERTQTFSFPYRVVEPAVKGLPRFRLEWLHDKQGLAVDTNNGNERIEGRIQDAIDHAWKIQQRMDDLFIVSKDVFGLEFDEARIHADMAVLKILADRRITAMYNADTEMKTRIIKSSVEGGALKGMGALTGQEFDDYVNAKVNP